MLVNLFDGESPQVYENITLTPPGLTVTVQKVDEYPGASQSGFHLWPAAHQLSNYLAETWHHLSPSTITPTTTTTTPPPTPSPTKNKLRVAEMGCGMGLASISVAAL